MAALPLAVILALATDPACGAAAPGSEFAQRLAAIATQESGGDTLAIGVNADPARGVPAAKVHSNTPDEAATRARDLIARHRSIDLGLMQINSVSLARHHLTVEAAFDGCASMKAGAEHYAGDVNAAAIFSLAHRRYNTGGFERGGAYAASIERIIARVRAVQPAPVATETAAQPPAQPPCAPSWDAWALASCSAQSAPSPAEATPPAATVTATIGSSHADE